MRVTAQNAEDIYALSDEERAAYHALRWLLDPLGDAEVRQRVITLATLDRLMTYPGIRIPLLSQTPGLSARMLVWQDLRRRMRELGNKLKHAEGYESATVDKG